jgi:hypothetical protein
MNSVGKNYIHGFLKAESRFCDLKVEAAETLIEDLIMVATLGKPGKISA